MAEEVTFGTYYVRAGVEAEFERLIPQNWATLQKLGFIRSGSNSLYRSVSGPTRYLELTRWVPGAMGPAHEHPDVIPIWVKLAALVEPHQPPAAEQGLVFDEFVPVDLG